MTIITRAAACIALAAVNLAFGLAEAATAPRDETFARHTVSVAPHVWLIYRTFSSTHPPFEGNVEVFEQSDGLVIVDAGGCPRSGEEVVAQVKKLSPKRAKFLIYTHFHGDHNLGAGALRKAWPGLTIISTAATREDMTTAPMQYLTTYSKDYQGTVDYAGAQVKKTDLSASIRAGWQQIVDAGPSMVAAYANMKAYPADVTFTDKLSIPDTDTPLEVSFLGRANTDGDAVVWAPKQRVIAAGDIVVNPVPYASASYITDWIAVLQKLKSFDYIALVPGHGTIQHDQSYLDRLISALTDIKAQVAALAAQGLTIDQVNQKVNFDKLRDEFAGQDDWERARLQGFFLGPIVSNAYKEAKGEAIVQGKDGG
jgi:glyoxylase-like metal-dependent hydrolase (beta-lactamase superfamily II)